MKRLRASEQGDAGVPAGAPGAAADPGAAIIKAAALSENPANSQTAIVSAIPVPGTARQEDPPQPRCNGDVPQMLSQRKAE